MFEKNKYKKLSLFMFLSLSQVLNLFFQWEKKNFYSNSECASRINNKSKVRLQSLLHGQRPEKTVKDFNSECLTITFYLKSFFFFFFFFYFLFFIFLFFFNILLILLFRL